MRVLVTGAAGFIGLRVCEALTGAGHAVTALVRPLATGRAIPACDRLVYGALPFEVPARAWADVEAVVHCAAATKGEDAGESRAINVEGTRLLIERAKELPRTLRRFVFLSSQSAHEHAVSSYGITKREGEALVRASGLAYAIIRPGLVYGAGAEGIFARAVKLTRGPVLLIPGTGDAIVQPIEVGDLAEAIVRCLGADLPMRESFELNLGDSEGLTLGDLLRKIVSIGRDPAAKPKREVRVPLGPVKFGLKAADAINVKLPISKDNIAGLEVVQRMDTLPSLEQLSLRLRPFDDALARALGKEPVGGGIITERRSSQNAADLEEVDGVPGAQAAERRRTKTLRAAAPRPDPATLPRFNRFKILLVGAGKIGIVHALNLARREEMELAGIVDVRAKSFRLYRSMGFRTRYYTDLERALDEVKPDGAIIATPASTHVDMAQKLMSRRIPVLVEKPLAIRREMLKELADLAKRYDRVPVHVGYMAAQYPHLDAARQMLASGELGQVKSFRALAVQSHIMGAKPLRWEMEKAKSGGGALINFSGHVLSMLLRLLGEPDSVDARAWPVYSTEVEDAVDVRLRYPGGLQGRLFGTWSAPGFARPENRVEIECEAGVVVVENAATSLRWGKRTARIWTQRDYDIGFNAAPDYTGAGFSVEHLNFAHALQRIWAPAGGGVQEESFSNLKTQLLSVSQLQTELIPESANPAASDPAAARRGGAAPRISGQGTGTEFGSVTSRTGAPTGRSFFASDAKTDTGPGIKLNPSAPIGKAVVPPGQALADTPVTIEEAMRLEMLMFHIYERIEMGGGLGARFDERHGELRGQTEEAIAFDRRIETIIESLGRP